MHSHPVKAERQKMQQTQNSSSLKSPGGASVSTYDRLETTRLVGLIIQQFAEIHRRESAIWYSEKIRSIADSDDSQHSPG